MRGRTLEETRTQQRSKVTQRCFKSGVLTLFILPPQRWRLVLKVLNPFQSRARGPTRSKTPGSGLICPSTASRSVCARLLLHHQQLPGPDLLQQDNPAALVPSAASGPVVLGPTSCYYVLVSLGLYLIKPVWASSLSQRQRGAEPCDHPRGRRRGQKRCTCTGSQVRTTEQGHVLQITPTPAIYIVLHGNHGNDKQLDSTSKQRSSVITEREGRKGRGHGRDLTTGAARADASSLTF